MRMLKIAIPCAFLLTGYASLATQSAGDAAAPAIEPGQWEFATEVTSLEFPGAPGELVARMRATMTNERQVTPQCITPEQARNPTRALMAGQNSGACEFPETIWSGGIVRIRATCRSSDTLSDAPPDTPPSGPPMQLSIEGSYAARQIDYQLNLTMEMPNPAEDGAPTQLRLQAMMTGRRTGDCATPDPLANQNSLAPVN